MPDALETVGKPDNIKGYTVLCRRLAVERTFASPKDFEAHPGEFRGLGIAGRVPVSCAPAGNERKRSKYKRQLKQRRMSQFLRQKGT